MTIGIVKHIQTVLGFIIVRICLTIPIVIHITLVKGSSMGKKVVMRKVVRINNFF